jgi:hypothetical protein
MKPSPKDLPIVAPVTPGHWVIDSGRTFDIVSRSDLTAQQKNQMMFDGSPVMQTAEGETRALGTVNLVDPIGRPIEAHVLKDSQSLIFWGRLCGEEGFSFRWESGKKPQLKSADGVWMTLDVQNRVPVWPMGRRVPRGVDAEFDLHSARGDYACPNQE